MVDLSMAMLITRWYNHSLSGGEHALEITGIYTYCARLAKLGLLCKSLKTRRHHLV